MSNFLGTKIIVLKDKKMKNLIYKVILIFAAFIISINTQAQEKEEITVPLSNPNAKGKLVIGLLDGSIKVVGYKGKEVIVTASLRAGKYKNKTKDGMRRINTNSLDFSVEEIDNTVKVRTKVSKPITDFEIKVPENFSLSLRTINQGNIIVENVNGEIEASNTNGEIKMENINGSVIADALNRDITVSFVDVLKGSSMAFTSLNGDIDITFPENLKAKIKARSDNGNVYTDFEIKLDAKAPVTKKKTNGVYKVTREKGVSGLINGGGALMTFKTLNGDILIRAKE